MTFLEQEEAQGETVEEFRKRLSNKTLWLACTNAFGPACLFLGLGLGLWAIRRGRKRAFLSQL